jgi:uncharacterized protein (TIGR03066 family)
MHQLRGLFAAVICLGIAGTAAAQVTKDAKDDNKSKIVGVWIVVKGEGVPAGTPMEFTKDGKLVLKFEINGKEIKMEGTYKVDGDKVTVSMKTPDGKEDVETDTIKELTDSKFVVTDPKGKEVEFKRASAK